jgi:hypothetical protein
MPLGGLVLRRVQAPDEIATGKEKKLEVFVLFRGPDRHVMSILHLFFCLLDWAVVSMARGKRKFP